MIMKRCFDLSFSLIGILCTVPLLITLSILIKKYMGSPIIFKQFRPGINGTPFNFYKFRTMKNKRHENGKPLSDEDRLTALGKFLRKMSLDELPSLWNVLKGDMSLVGPRPLLMEYLPLYSKKQMIRHKIKPGITGWAQINGRNTISWEQKFKLDIWYVQNQSFWIDIKIIFITIFKVLKQEGINQNNNNTMEKFKGN